MEQTQTLDQAVGRAFMSAAHGARQKLLEINNDGKTIDVGAIRTGDCQSLDVDACNDAIFPIWDQLVLHILCLCADKSFSDPDINAAWNAMTQTEKLAYGAGLTFSYKNFVRCVVSATFFQNWRRSLGRPNQAEVN